MKVLIIDDARVMRSIIANAIKENLREDVEILEAADGQEAFDLLERQSPDIIFVDWNMPRMDGLEFTKKVRGAGRMLPLIMITSEAARYMVVEAVKAGVTDYIVKPIVGRQLWEKIGIYFRK